MEIVVFLLYGVLGCCIGSFLCLCAARFQRDESVFFPPSHCDRCGHPLGIRDLVPLFSYLYQKGHCRYCGCKLPASLFWREAATGLLFILVARLPGSLSVLGVRWLLVSLMLLLSWLDMDELQVYEDLLYPLGILFLVLRMLQGQSLIPGLAGAVLLGGFLQLIHWLSPQGMGAGDPRLAAVLGLWLGPVQGFKSFFLALGAGLSFALVRGIRATENRWASVQAPVPLAPFFCGCGLLLQFLDLGGLPGRTEGTGMLYFLGVLDWGSLRGWHRLEEAVHWFRRILEPWPAQLLGVQLGKDRVTLAQVRRKGKKWEVERVQELSWPDRIQKSLGRKQTEETIWWLREVCTKQGFTVRQTVFSLASDLMVFRELTLPGLSLREQEETAPWEILQQIPYGAGTFQLALSPFPEQPDLLLAGAVSTEVLEICRNLADGMEWELLQVEAAPQAWGRWLEEEPAAFLLALGDTSLQGAWYRKGQLLGTCRLEPTEKMAEGGETLLQRLWEMAGPSVAEQFQEGPTGVFLVGGKKDEQQSWLDRFQALWDCPAASLSLGPWFCWAPYYEAGKKAPLSAGLCGALGSLLSKRKRAPFCYGAGSPGCFLQPEGWSRLGKGLLAFSLVLWLAGTGALYLAERNLDQCRQQLQQASGWEHLWQKQQENRKELERQERIQKEQSRRPLPWGGVLTLLGHTLPSSCWVTQVEQETGRNGATLLLQGKSLGRESLLQLVRRLQRQPGVASVRLERMEHGSEAPRVETFALRLQWKGEEYGT